jgi:hypothetical protein
MHFPAAGQEPEVPRDTRVRLVVVIRIVEHVFFWEEIVVRRLQHNLAILLPMTVR